MSRRRKSRVRQKGKLSLSRYFQQLEKGQRVVIKPVASLQPAIPIRFKGRAGVVEVKRGNAYVVRFKDGKMDKRLIIKPIHLIKVS